MLATVLETTGAGIPSIVAGAVVLVIALGLVGWVIGMGSGRPNTK